MNAEDVLRMLLADAQDVWVNYGVREDGSYFFGIETSIMDVDPETYAYLTGLFPPETP